MNLEEALKEIERLNRIIIEKDREIKKLRSQKNAGRKNLHSFCLYCEFTENKMLLYNDSINYQEWFL